MPIPQFNEEGLLPEGIHDCTLEEIEFRFGRFLGSDRRPQLWQRFLEFVREVRASGAIEAILLDGSFATAKPDPNDIDIVLAVSALHNFDADLPLALYNVMAQQRVRRRFGFDIVVVNANSEKFEQAVTFFKQVRQRPGAIKGILKLQV